MPFGDILIYKRPPSSSADFLVSGDDAASTSQWDLAELAIRATVLASPWLRPLVVSVHFCHSDPARDESKTVLLRSRQGAEDLLIPEHWTRLKKLKVDQIDEEVLRATFTEGLGAPEQGPEQVLWDGTGMHWEALTVHAALTLVGPAVDQDHFVVRDHLDQLLTHEVVAMEGKSWVETDRPGQRWPPVAFRISPEDFVPGVFVSMVTNWSSYGNPSAGQQSGELRRYFAELEKLGWTTHYRP